MLVYCFIMLLSHLSTCIEALRKGGGGGGCKLPVAPNRRHRPIATGPIYYVLQ